MIVPITRISASLITDAPNPEFDVNGVTDPFLQVTALKLIRLLGKGCSETSITASDILRQVYYKLSQGNLDKFLFRFLKKRIIQRMRVLPSHMKLL